MFSNDIQTKVDSVIQSRIQSVNDLQHRNHPILPHYKVGDSAELTKALLNCLCTLSDEEKQEIINTLQKFMSKL